MVAGRRVLDRGDQWADPRAGAPAWRQAATSRLRRRDRRLPRRLLLARQRAGDPAAPRADRRRRRLDTDGQVQGDGGRDAQPRRQCLDRDLSRGLSLLRRRGPETRSAARSRERISGRRLRRHRVLSGGGRRRRPPAGRELPRAPSAGRQALAPPLPPPPPPPPPPAGGGGTSPPRGGGGADPPPPTG